MWKIVQRYEQTCEKCSRIRDCVWVEHELGQLIEVITRWCACPFEELFELELSKLPKVKTKPPKDGAI